MKKINIVPAVMLICSIVFCLATCTRNHNFKQDVKSVAGAPAPVKHKKDKDGYDIAYIEQHYISREAAETMFKKKLDSVAGSFGINGGRIIDYSEYGITKTGALKGQADTPIYIHDTVYLPFTMSDENIEVTGAIKGREVTGTAVVKLNIETTNYWDRKWLLGDPHFYQAIKSKDKNVTIDSMFNIHIADAELSRVSIGAFAGYDVLNMKPAAGISVNYDIYRFKKRKKKVK